MRHQNSLFATSHLSFYPQNLAAEFAALACGRLDAVVSAASPTARHFLMLRATLVARGHGASGMIALLRPDGEGESELVQFRDALRTGASRLQDGAMPTLALLQALVGEPLLRDPELVPLDAVLRDAERSTPPLLKGVVAANALRQRGPGSAALAFSLVLRAGGVLPDGWLSIPRATIEQEDADEATWTALAFAAIATEASRARGAVDLLRECLAADQTRLRVELGRAAWSALDLLALLQREPVLSIPQAAGELGQTVPTAGAAIARLESLGMVQELTGRGRDRLWAYTPALTLLAPE